MALVNSVEMLVLKEVDSHNLETWSTGKDCEILIGENWDFTQKQRQLLLLRLRLLLT